MILRYLKHGIRLAIYSEANIVKNRYANKCNVEKIPGIFNLTEIISESNSDTANIKSIVNKIY